MKIINACMDYYEQALELSYTTYKNECQYVTAIDGATRENISKYLVEIFEKQKVLLCISDNELVGYLGCTDIWEDNDKLFFNIPLWGYGAVGNDRTKIISLLFQNLAEQLCIGNKTHFSINLYAHDLEMIQLFSFLQFGILCEESIYNDQIHDTHIDQVNYRELMAGEKSDQWNTIWKLLDQLIKHLRKSPVFYLGTEFTEEVYKSFILSENTRVVVAEANEKMIGIITATSDSNSFINDHDDYYNVGDIYVDPKYRGCMVAQTMLEHLIHVLTDSGMQRCWVEHGTANPNARGFWNKYFTSYAYTMIREIELL